MAKKKNKEKKLTRKPSKKKAVLKRSVRSKPRRKPRTSSGMKKAKTRPIAKRPKKAIVGEEAILKLIEKGRHRGFVTQSEILHTFPHIERDIEGLEKLYERLDSANINVVDTGKAFAEEYNKELDEKKKLM